MWRDKQIKYFDTNINTNKIILKLKDTKIDIK